MKFIKGFLNILVDFGIWIIKIIPTNAGSRVRRLIYALLMKESHKFIIAENVTVTGLKNIQIGNNTSIMSNSYLYAHDASLKIGNNCSINNNVQISAAQGQISIGNDVLIGANSVIRAGTHNYSRTDIPIRKQGHNQGKILIEDDVWLSSNVVVTSNVKLGKGCVVAAGAVVTKDIPSYAVVGGVPARILKRRK